MAELLLELFSEEIPARMQGQAARDLERLFVDKLKDAGLSHGKVQAFAGPRRLTLVVADLPPAQEDRTEERKGPRANAPEQAIEGFLRSTGLKRAELEEREGVLFANIARKGRPTPEIVAEALEQVVRSFPWPKSMTWGVGSLRWVRPLKRILCAFGDAVVPFSIDGIASGDVTEGHRFMGSGQAFRANDFASYQKALRENFVVLDASERKRVILEKSRELCAKGGFELVEDEGLLDEVAGLAEWPVPILGDMDPSFLDLPPEVIRTSMRTHQKYFAVRDPKRGELAPHFVAVANIEAKDGGKAIAAGNARVLSARLNDARFFWDEDRKEGNFERWLEKLRGVTFHAELGTMSDRVDRIIVLSRAIASIVGADENETERAALLAKADLASGMVGEFPELQGIMGSYYASAIESPPSVSQAIRDQYKPAGPGDVVPNGVTEATIALADKIDAISAFYIIDEKPSGSRDPYALRRAALGVIRIILANNLRIGLRLVFGVAELGATRNYIEAKLNEPKIVPFNFIFSDGLPEEDKNNMAKIKERLAELSEVYYAGLDASRELIARSDLRGPDGGRAGDWELAFLADRLKVQLREEGKRHDLVDAVFALGDDDLMRIVARVEALSGFLSTDDGKNLLAGYKRAVNILRAEAKKNPKESYDGAPDPKLFAEPEERALETALLSTLKAMEPQLEREDFTSAMASLAALRKPVDAFFDKVLVNDERPDIRMNRLRLLSQIRDAANRVADFSLIAG
jgi:glycyl-tRNA synthetase beta chain